MKNIRWDRKTLSRNSMFALILLCIVLVAHEIFGQHGWLALRHEKTEYETLQQQIKQLQQENQKLEQQVKALKSDPQAIEKLAREQMRMARPGEIIYTLPEKDPKAQTPSAPAGQNQAK